MRLRVVFSYIYMNNKKIKEKIEMDKEALLEYFNHLVPDENWKYLGSVKETHFLECCNVGL